MTSAADLFALQEIDLSRDAHRALIADIDFRLTENEALDNARAAFEDAEDDLTLATRQQRNLEGQLADLDAKIQPLEIKLYNGSVRNPKELSDIQKEVQNLKARRDKLDDEGLANMEAVEAATTALDAARGALAEAEAAFKDREVSLLNDRSRYERETESLEADRTARTKGMDAAALGFYEKLRTVKQGRAVSRLERTMCGACHITLPTHLIGQVKSAATLIQCPNCERILSV